MKKIKLCLVGLSLSGVCWGQVNEPKVELTKWEVREMINTIDEILEWQQQDIEEAQYNGEDCSCGSYEEGWGSNYWLTLMREELYIAYTTNHKN
tara:strand:+ start:171 stop:452 length:282 start_codon:yes stop_codon:yes gene_type:complete